MLILGGLLIVLSILIASVEVKAIGKRKKIRVSKEIVHSNLQTINSALDSKSQTFYDSLSIGLGTVGLNLLDIYSQIDKHKDVLNIIEQRFPNEIGDATPLEWFNKIEKISSNGNWAIDNYVSAFKGQQAENIALELLRHNGFNAKLFDSLHPNDDILVTLGNNHEISYSVKCGSLQYIRDSISVHPESTHYIINSEAYKLMEQKGLLTDYARHGIEIINGGYSNQELASIGHDTISNIHEAGNVAHDVPVVALAVFGIKTISNIINFSKGNQTGYEFGVNVTTDFVRVGTGGAFAVGGAKLGGIIGTFIAPGLGTIIGGGIGAVAGAFTGGNIFNWTKERIKWGKIIDAIEYYGSKYENGLTVGIKKVIGKEYFNIQEVENSIDNEKRLVEKYKSQLDPYSREKVTLAAVLSKEYLENMKATKVRIQHSIELFHKELFNLCQKTAQNMYGNNTDKQMKVRRRYLGEILLSNQWILEKESLNQDESNLLFAYNEQMKIADNHPYKFNVDPHELFKGLAYKCYNEIPLTKMNQSKNYRPIIPILSITLFIIGVKFIFL